MNEGKVNRIYDILVYVCGAQESMRSAFIYAYQKDAPPKEWRIGGKLGFGGKFRLNSNGMYVDYYSEDESRDRDYIRKLANIQLGAL